MSAKVKTNYTGCQVVRSAVHVTIQGVYRLGGHARAPSAAVTAEIAKQLGN